MSKLICSSVSSCFMLSVFVACFTFASGWTQDGANQKQTEQDEQARVERQDLMRAKLMYSQNIVEGLSVKNFKLISESAMEIEAIMRADTWQASDKVEYKRLNAELRMAAQNLANVSERGNLEAAALRYFDLTLRCIDCHEYLRANDF